MKASSSGARRWGSACVTCRRRKIKCDGNKPSCSLCVRLGEQCIYRDVAGVAELQRQLQRAVQRIRELEDQLASADRPQRRFSVHAGLPEDANDALTLVPSNEAESASEDDEDSPEGARAKMSVDDHGMLQYYGATSRFHVAPDQGGDVFETKELMDEMQRLNDETHSSWLLSSAHLQKSWERIAFANVQQNSGITPELSSILLERYWTWQQPLHNCVYRRCFVRDMALGGPYFSPFLLNVIYAHACRHIDAEDPNFEVVGRGEIFMQRAKVLLLSEMERSRPQIPTIQGLLILGGRQCAIGNSSEGWLYTGMAIRMIRDLGLHLNVQKFGRVEKMNPDDLEARKRLFLSAYVWDKSISICLGRPPTLTEMPYRPESILDTSDDAQEWIPFGLPDTEKIYPPTKSYNTTTFINHCRLSQIINECYHIIYDGKARPNLTQAVMSLETKVRKFYQSLPDALRIENISSNDICPPPHIFSLNILYHTVLILIYRPFLYWSSNVRLRSHELVPRAQKICFEETSSVNEFFKAHGRTFNFKLQTYLVSYCVYTAATVDVFLVKSEHENVARAAHERLGVTLKMLESEARQTPGMQRSIEIIKARMNSQNQSSPYQTQKEHTASQSLLPPDQGALPGAQQAMFPQKGLAQTSETMPLTAGATQPGNMMSMYRGMEQHDFQGMAHTGSHDQRLPGQVDVQGHEGLQYARHLQPEMYPANFASQSWAVNNTTSPNQLMMEGWNASAGFVPDVVNWNVQDMMAPSVGYDTNLSQSSQM